MEDDVVRRIIDDVVQNPTYGEFLYFSLQL